MNPEYLQVPESSQQSFATSVGGDSNEIATGTDRLNCRSWPGMSAHTPNRLSVSSQFPETGPQLSAFGSIATNRASLVSLPDGPSNPLSFIYLDTGTAVEAPMYGADYFGDLSQLESPGGGESSRTGSSYDKPEDPSPDPDILVNASLQRLEELQGPYKILNLEWRNVFREILAVPDSMPDSILERIGLRHELVVAYKERLESVKEMSLPEAFEVGVAKDYLQSTEQVLAMYCEINADTMFGPRYQVDPSVRE
jgi:hypothetical protein